MKRESKHGMKYHSIPITVKPGTNWKMFKKLYCTKEELVRWFNEMITRATKAH